MEGKNGYKPRTYERKSKTADQALSALMRLCSRAERSSGDALRLMAGWGVPEGERAAVLDKLIRARFIDDVRYAECYVRDKISFSGWGRYKIVRGLAAKGISKDIIAEVTAVVGDRDQSTARLRALLGKKMNRTAYKDVYDLKGKLLRHAASQGYPYDEVTEVIERLLKDKEIKDDE